MVNESLLIANIPIVSPFIESVREIVMSLQWLVGGIFGLYLILVFLRWRESKVVAKVLKEIRDDIKELSKDIKMVNQRVNKIEKKRK